MWELAFQNIIVHMSVPCFVHSSLHTHLLRIITIFKIIYFAALDCIPTRKIEKWLIKNDTEDVLLVKGLQTNHS